MHYSLSERLTLLYQRLLAVDNVDTLLQLSVNPVSAKVIYLTAIHVPVNGSVINCGGIAVKVHEEFLRGTVKELLEVSEELKGEMVVIMDGNHDDYSKDVDYGMILSKVNENVALGMTKSEAIRHVAAETGFSKNKIYELVHSKEN